MNYSNAEHEISEPNSDSETPITASDLIGAFKGSNMCAKRLSAVSKVFRKHWALTCADIQQTSGYRRSPWFIRVEFRRFWGKMARSIADELVRSCGPLLAEEGASRSIVVCNVPEEVREEDIIIHFQKRQHGGGDIDHVQMMENINTVVVTFESYKGWWFSCNESRQGYTSKAL